MNIFKSSCREVTRLVLQRADRALTLPERLGIRWHMLICKACPTFAKQVKLMQGAMGRWKHYGESD